jgi:hypothetical protein
MLEFAKGNVFPMPKSFTALPVGAVTVSLRTPECCSCNMQTLSGIPDFIHYELK